MATITLSKNFPPTTKSVLTITESSRTSEKTKFNLSVKTNLVSSTGYVGTTISLYGKVEISGTGITTQTKTLTLKKSSEEWRGTSVHTTTGTFEVNIPANINDISVKYTVWYSDVPSDTMSGSTSMSLTKLISELAPLGVGVNIEDTITLGITQYDDTFTQDLKVYFRDENNNKTLIGTFNNVVDGTQITLNSTQKNQIYNLTPNNNFYNMTWDLITYSGATELGTYSLPVVGLIPSAISSPIFTDFNYQDINPITSALSNNVILGYSTLKVSIPTNKKAIAQKGASIVSYSVEDVSLPYSSTQEVYTDPGLPNYNKNTLTVTAYDTRQNSTPVVKNLNVVNYTKLTADETQKSYQRQNNVGTQTKITFGGTWWNDNFGLKDNVLIVSYKYKIVGSPNWTQGGNITPTISGNNYSFDNYIRGDAPDNGFLVENSYDLVVRVEDKLEYVEFVYQIIAGVPAIKIKGNKVIEMNGEEPIFFEGDDYIEEQGITNGWTYRKWNSGIYECWKRDTTAVTSWAAWGSLYEGSPHPSSIAFPITFTEIPSVFIGVNRTDAGGGILYETGRVTTSTIQYIVPIRPNSGSAATYAYDIRVIGKWK